MRILKEKKGRAVPFVSVLWAWKGGKQSRNLASECRRRNHHNKKHQRNNQQQKEKKKAYFFICFCCLLHLLVATVVVLVVVAPGSSPPSPSTLSRASFYMVEHNLRGFIWGSNIWQYCCVGRIKNNATTSKQCECHPKRAWICDPNNDNACDPTKIFDDNYRHRQATATRLIGDSVD